MAATGLQRANSANDSGGNGCRRRADNKPILTLQAGLARAIRFSYRGHEVISMPPPSSGGVAGAIAERRRVLSGRAHGA